MKIDVTDILSGRVSTLDFEYTDGAPNGSLLRSMLPEGVTVDDDGIFVSGRVNDTGGYMSLSCNVTVDYTCPCDRCLEECDFYVDFTFDRVISAAASPEDRERLISEDDEEWDGVLDDLIYVSGGCIDFTDDLAEAIALEIPLRHLCDDDCRGLCQICGKKITDEHPGCTPKKEIDPRLAVLQKLLDKSEKND
ncbi:MAG: DUF177 domain-containing protein [Clostridia bacterium]|nr:DUF177 domain-containing protein [Clostridia bacterium]